MSRTQLRQLLCLVLICCYVYVSLLSISDSYSMSSLMTYWVSLTPTVCHHWWHTEYLWLLQYVIIYDILSTELSCLCKISARVFLRRRGLQGILLFNINYSLWIKFYQSYILLVALPSSLWIIISWSCFYCFYIYITSDVDTIWGRRGGGGWVGCVSVCSLGVLLECYKGVYIQFLILRINSISWFMVCWKPYINLGRKV